ncbi:MAG: PDDEXK nuclease domain-containing protein [Euryarchaeota archaeon]|nr:PDDEXK nuclease domain-containing protein [Euryarchaeota archaeon]
MMKRSHKSTDIVPKNTDSPVIANGILLEDIRGLIESAKSRFAQTANAALVTLYWNIGNRIKTDILGNERAQYGKEIVSALSRQLTTEYGAGFSDKTLRHMIRFAEVYPDEQIVSALQRQLSWTHFKEIIYIDDQLKRGFYAEMCRVERWSTRTLHDKIQGMLYERTAISRKPAELARQELDSLRNDDRMTPDLVFRDPYLLDFLGLSDTYSERDLESAILKELERFLLELGTDFSFVARQKRITIDNEDYYLDLLFYHRGMRCLVAIELKLGKFQAADKGQMELYLRWLDKYEKRESEEMPLGLILCAEKSYEHVELLRLEESGMYVTEYLTDLPPRRLLEAKLHEAIRMAREQIAVREGAE